MSESTEIVRREDRPPTALESLLGSGDMQLMVESAKHNINIAIDIARSKGFVTDYEVKNKQGEVTGYRAWYHHPTWQLLGQTYGVTAFTEGSPKEIKPGVWEAAAVVQTVQDGRVVGRAVALCARTEPGKKFKGDHDLAATAQSRAQRNALRSTLGAILVVAGFDFPDPDAPATTAQVGLLHQLERETGLSHEQGHAEAGDVGSYRDLTREQAAEVIDRWGKIVQQGSAGVAGESSGEDRSPAESPAEVGEGDSRGDAPSPPESAPAGDTIVDGPATDEQWKRAIKAGLTANKAILRARERWPEAKVTAGSAITRNQLAALIEEALG